MSSRSTASASELAAKAEAGIESFRNSVLAFYVGGPHHGWIERLNSQDATIEIPVLREPHQPTVERYFLEFFRFAVNDSRLHEGLPYYRHESLSQAQSGLIFMNLLLSSYARTER